MNNEVDSKQTHEFPAVAMCLSILLTTIVKGILEDSFANLQALSDLMDFGLFFIIFAPSYYVMSKLTQWLYVYINEFNR